VEGYLLEVQRLGRVGLPAGLRATPMIFSGALVGVVCMAARRAGPARAGAAHLALALLDDPASRAYEALRLGQVDLVAARQALAATAERSPTPPAIRAARMTGNWKENQLAMAEISAARGTGTASSWRWVIVALGEDWLPPLWLVLLDRAAPAIGPIHRTQQAVPDGTLALRARRG
jgi:hypothetical protein